MKNVLCEREKKKFKRLELTRRQAKDVKLRMGTRNEAALGERRLHIRKRLLLRVVGPWNGFPREVVVAPSLPEYNEGLKDTL